MRQNLAVTTGRTTEAKQQHDMAGQYVEAGVGAKPPSSGNQAKVSIDMHNISANEYNELVRSGITDLPVPLVLPGGRVQLDGQQSEMGEVKTDYIAQITQSIEFKKSIGDISGVDFLMKRLAQVEELHGKEYTPTQAGTGIDQLA
ncbi:hypothetical protein LZP73_15765 [Shewanella sp. AS16]|uniref:hypothetical protein n=1 Tax=Shewanella sp. AS16 TaxID=2907625 RepID=UPI001F2BF2BB|nr:hypothetical protein [Shewanella sp. AS16]MCE9687645.1 hypothetical protein [Shewanella sp. AS16]